MQTVLSIIAVVLSFLSILVAFFSAYITYQQNKKINSINMRAKYFGKIFDNYLITKIPEARKYLRFDANNKLSDYENLLNVMSELLRDAIYFRYENNAFYLQLKEKIHAIEDYISNCANNEYVQEEQGVVFSKVHDMLSELYGCINDNYMGKYRGV